MSGGQRRERKKILNQVYTVHDSSNELQKEKSEALPVGTWWYWVSIGRHWLKNDGALSVEGGTC